jgi:hypothetical protein
MNLLVLLFLAVVVAFFNSPFWKSFKQGFVIGYTKKVDIARRKC